MRIGEWRIEGCSPAFDGKTYKKCVDLMKIRIKLNIF